MTLHRLVKVGQVWRSNDVRNLRAVKVIKIRSYESGASVQSSTGEGVSKQDLVMVENVITQKKTTIRRGMFTTGVRGWSLDKEVTSGD